MILCLQLQDFSDNRQRLTKSSFQRYQSNRWLNKYLPQICLLRPHQQFGLIDNPSFLQLLIKLMSHSKSTILSKADKMKLKRDRKKSLTPPIIELIDSDNSKSQEPTPKPAIVEVLLPKSNNNSGKAVAAVKDAQLPETQRHSDANKPNISGPNMFNFDRLKKYGATPPEAKLSILKTEVCEEAHEITAYEGRSLIGYKIVGVEQTKYISENHLKQRVEDAKEIMKKLEEERQKQLMRQKEKKEEGEEVDQKSEEKEGEEKEEKSKGGKGKNYRYFDLEESSGSEEEDDEETKKKSTKCFRCGEKGHIARNCHLEEKIVCMFCLGAHHYRECSDTLCYRCNQPGHVSQDCRNNGVKCRRCRRVGHVQKECGTIVMLDYSSSNDAEIRERYSESDLKRLKCLAECRHRKGHFNCFDYGSRPQKIYGSSQKSNPYKY